MRQNEDVWDEFAAFLAKMMEKYVDVIDLDSLPDPPRYQGEEEKSEKPAKKPKKSEKALDRLAVL